MKIEIDHNKDGIEHINCYTKGKTELGVMLGNLYLSPFIHHDDGPFNSIEGYWYWLQTNDNRLRFLHGVEAKKLGKEIINEKGSIFRDDFKKKIKEALLLKIEENKEIKEGLVQSRLPLIHYYVRSDQNKTFSVPLKKHDWIFEEIEKIRFTLNGVEVSKRNNNKNDSNEIKDRNIFSLSY